MVCVPIIILNKCKQTYEFFFLHFLRQEKFHLFGVNNILRNHKVEKFNYF